MARIVRDARERTEFLVTLWSRHRTREPFLDTLFSRWRSVGLPDLAGLDADALVVVEAFYDELEELRLYLRWTEDMPTTLRERYEKRVGRLDRAAEAAIARLGGLPEGVRRGRPAVPLDAPDPGPA